MEGEKKKLLTSEVISVPALCCIDRTATLALSTLTPSAVPTARAVSERLVEDDATRTARRVVASD